MIKYGVRFPDGTSGEAMFQPDATHAVVVNTIHGWLVDGGFGREVDAQIEAAYLQRKYLGADVQVAPVTPLAVVAGA